MSKLVKRFCYECSRKTEMVFDGYEVLRMVDDRDKIETWKLKWMKCPKCGDRASFTRRRVKEE